MLRLLLFVLLFLAPPAFAGGVDINTASVEELDTLPGIGPSKAAAIIAHRDQHGAFTSVDALDDVTGIGPATLANLRDLVTVGDGATTAEPATATLTVTRGSEPSSEPSSAPSSAAYAVNINTADASELQTLAGLGPAKAEAILADREANGPFASCDDLQRVTGIGPATVTSILDRCKVE